MEEYKKFYNNSMNKPNKSNKIAIIKDASGNEAVMVRVDKTVKELMEEKPSSRWDVSYHHPEFDRFFSKLSDTRFELVTMGSLMLDGTDGITYGQVGRREYDKSGTIQYLQVSNIKKTGVDIHEQYARIKSGSHNDPPRSRLNELDVLLINGGVGSIGRSGILVKKDREYNISQDIDRIRFKSPKIGLYITVFLNSIFGQKQIERFSKGVSGQTKFGFEHVRAIKIPLLPEKVQTNIASAYKKMSAFHDKAMEAKKKGDEQGYQKNKETAEAMLRDLIAKTESLIRGEREDVV